MEETSTSYLKSFQYYKSKYPNAIHLFRIGDVYEAYEQDAIDVADTLGLSHTYFTGKSGLGINNPDGAISIFPYHALDTYLPKLIRASKSVAIYDQQELSKNDEAQQGYVLKELVTPGLTMHVVNDMKDVSDILSEEAMLRDTLIEKMRSAGIKVSTDVVAAEKVLEQVNGNVRLMGSTTNNRQKKISVYYSNKELSDIEKIVVDAFCGITDNSILSIEDKKGKVRNILFQQGTDDRVGIKHSVYKHFNTAANYYNVEDILIIPEIIRNGIRTQNGSKILYRLEKGEDTFSFTTVMSGKNEKFTNFFTKRNPKDKEQGASYTANQHAQPNLSVSAAKLQQNSETTKENGENFHEHRVFHGSGNDFDEFDHLHMGEGEGNQSYGWGTYVTEVEGIGRMYAEQGRGKYLYKNSNWEKLWHSEHTPEVIAALDVIERRENFENYETFEESIEKIRHDAEQAIESFGEDESYTGSVTHYREKISALEKMRESDFFRKEKILYIVEIPDDNGRNYFDYASEIDIKEKEKIRKFFTTAVINNMKNALPSERMDVRKSISAEFRLDVSNGNGVYKTMSKYLPDKEVSLLLYSLGYKGIKYPAEYQRGGREDKANNYVIFSEDDIKIKDKLRFFKTQQGQAYGFVHNGTIYIDPRISTAETPLHEYTHLWAEVLRQRNPEEWKNIVKMMKETPEVWNYVRRVYPSLTTDNEIADEALAHFSGKRGYERLKAMSAELSEPSSVLDRISSVLEKFWSSVASFFGVHYTSKEEVADRILFDLLKEVNPLDYKTADLVGIRESKEEHIYSQNFKEWFGDWEINSEQTSKVVDEQGKPLVVEHATNSDFTEFDINHLGENSRDNGLFGAGFYFGTEAPGWMKGAKNVMRVYLDIKKPFEVQANLSHNIYSEIRNKLDTPAMRQLELTGFNGNKISVGEYIDNIKAVDNLIEENMPFVEELIAKDEELKFIHPDKRISVWREHEISNRTGVGVLGMSWQVVILEHLGSIQFTEAAKKDGYDGVIVDRGDDYKEYVVFEPNQIKSATNNIGTFRKESNNINEHRVDPSLSDRPVRQKLSPADIEAGGAMVDRLNDMGIEVHTDIQENRKILKSAERDNSEVGKIRYFKTENGTSYGFAYKGELYLDPRKIDAELPLHEYAHLWCQALKRINPENWSNVVSTIKEDTASWNFIKDRYPELTDENELVEEVIAQYSGKRGAVKLQAEQQRMTSKDENYGSRWNAVFSNISKVIQDFWKHVGDSLNIQYKNKEDIADKILQDFAQQVNPVKKVEKWLKERDNLYADAVKNQPSLAVQLFEEALKENVGNGVTPFVSVGTYRGNLDVLARKVKSDDETIRKEAIEKAADSMAALIPDNAVLIPTPSHLGSATNMLELANAISKRTDAEVADVLKSDLRESQYDIKKRTGKPLSSSELHIRIEGELPKDKLPVVIDNVVDSGNTAEACVMALGGGLVVSLASATSQEKHVASLKSAAPVVYDKKGSLIPLSERFELKNKWLGRIMPFKTNPETVIAGLENYSEKEVQKCVREHFETALEGSDIDAEIVDMKIIGSRVNGDSDADSDLDVLLEYKGDISEDGLFNILNNEEEGRLCLEGIPVDINPITESKSGTIQEWIARNADYKKEMSNQNINNMGTIVLKTSEDKIKFLAEQLPNKGDTITFDKGITLDDRISVGGIGDMVITKVFNAGDGQILVGNDERSIPFSRMMDWNQDDVIDIVKAKAEQKEAQPYQLHVGEWGGMSPVFGEYHIDFGDNIKNVSSDDMQKIVQEMGGEMRITDGHTWFDFLDRATAERFAQRIVSLNSDHIVERRETSKEVGSHDLSDTIKEKMKEIHQLIKDENLEYSVLRPRLPVVADLSKDWREENHILSAAMVTVDDIIFYDNNYDSYDNKNGISIRELPEESQLEALDVIKEHYGDDNRQVTVHVDTVSFPVHLLPALQGDPLELTDEENSIVNNFMSRYTDTVGIARDMEPYFENNTLLGQGAECVKVDIFRYVTVAQLKEEKRQDDLGIYFENIEGKQYPLRDIELPTGETVSVASEELRDLLEKYKDAEGNFKEPSAAILDKKIEYYMPSSAVMNLTGDELSSEIMKEFHLSTTDPELLNRLDWLNDVLNDARSTIGDSFTIEPVNLPLGSSAVISEIRYVEDKEGLINEHGYYAGIDEQGEEIPLVLAIDSFASANSLIQAAYEAQIAHLVGKGDSIDYIDGFKVSGDRYITNVGFKDGKLNIQGISRGNSRFEFGSGLSLEALGELIENIRDLRKTEIEEDWQSEARDYLLDNIPDATSETKDEIEEFLAFHWENQETNEENLENFKQWSESLNNTNPQIEEPMSKTNSETTELSPMMKQFYDLKVKHPDSLLLFRVGDFYETYEEDAEKSSKILGITLTKTNRQQGLDGKALKMAGFPHHALDTYLPKLIRAGERVAICDQLEAPKQKPEKRITETVNEKRKPILAVFTDEQWKKMSEIGYPYAPGNAKEKENAPIPEMIYWRIAAGMITVDEASQAFDSTGYTVGVDMNLTHDILTELNTKYNKLDRDFKPIVSNNSILNIENTEEQTMTPEDNKKEKVEQQQTQQSAEQSAGVSAEVSSAEKKKRPFTNIDYSQYKMPEGVMIEKASIFPKKDAENIWLISAMVNGSRQTRELYPNDRFAYFAKNEDGTHRATLEQLAVKYFANPNKKETKEQNTQQEAAQQPEHPKFKEETQEAAPQEDKKKKAEPVSAAEIGAALLSAAIENSVKNDGIWLNASGKLAPRFANEKQVVSPYNALMMNLHSDANGYKSNVYTQYKQASNAGYSVRRDQKSLPFTWFGLDGYVNKWNHADKISDEAYKALSPEQQEDYKRNIVSEVRNIFNIDQTLMHSNSKEKYEEAISVPEKSKDTVAEGVSAAYTALFSRGENVEVSLSKYPSYDPATDTLILKSMDSVLEDEKITVAADNYRVMIEALSAPSRLNIGAYFSNLPSDQAKYEKLIQEVSAGVILARQGVPARLSKENYSLIPYWKRELVENPDLVKQIEKDVNKVVNVIGDLRKGKEINFSAIRGEKPIESLKTRSYTISSFLATIPTIESKQVVIVKDEKSKSADVILPTGASIEVDNETPGLNKARFAKALSREGFGDVKFYNAGGSFALNEANDYFAGKEIITASLKQYNIIEQEKIDVSQELAQAGKKDIEKVALIKDDDNKHALYVKPKGEEAFTIYPQMEDVRLFFNNVKTERFDEVKDLLGQKYYGVVQKHPDLKASVHVPQHEDVDISRISEVKFVKAKDKDATFMIYATIDGQQQQPVEITRAQYERAICVVDRELYKTHLAAQVFGDKLKVKEGEEIDQFRGDKRGQSGDKTGKGLNEGGKKQEASNPQTEEQKTRSGRGLH